jgi:acyl-coenzyme A thioesterase PaaI-like protein
MSSAPPFFTRYGISRTRDPDAPLQIEPYEAVCHRGVLRPTVLAAAVDLLGSFFARAEAGTDALLTTDLSVRSPARWSPASLSASGRALRVGRSVITSEAAFEAEGAPVAYGQTTFRRMARPAGISAAPGPSGVAVPEVFDAVPLDQPLFDEVGVSVVDGARGAVEVALRDALLNAEGGMQGALVALLVEASALALADASCAVPQVVTELDLRYLAAGRAGPVVSEAQWVAGPTGETLRVVLRDRGQGNRITTAAIARVAPAPAPLR